MKLKQFIALVFLLFFASTGFSEGERQVKPLRLGMLPSLSLQKLFERFTPLQQYLEKTLKRPVILLTAANYETYIQRASEYEYDLYFAAPHMAALAEADSGYRPVSMFTRDLSGYLIVRKDGPIKKVLDLKGRTVSAPETLAIITMMGETLLEEYQLIPGKDVIIDYTPTHNNAILALTAGKVDAAIASTAIFDIAKPEIREQLSILSTTKNVSHLMFMASPKLSDTEYAQLIDVMLHFTANGPGKEFFTRAPYGDMASLTREEMQKMKAYIPKLKQRITVNK